MSQDGKLVYRCDGDEAVSLQVGGGRPGRGHPPSGTGQVLDDCIGVECVRETISQGGRTDDGGGENPDGWYILANLSASGN